MVEVRLRLSISGQPDKNEVVDLRDGDAIDAEGDWLFVWRGDETVAVFERTSVVYAIVRDRAPAA